MPNRPKANAFSISGLIIGILGFFFSWTPIFGIPIGHTMGIAAIILSGIGMGQASRLRSGFNAGVTGLVFGIITVVLKSIPLLNLL